ncbi:MAG: GNAT family N-acetyltransferase [Dehalococcoidia bacterium]
MPYDMFEGKKVRLRGVRPGDWEQFIEWDRDSDASRYGWQVWQPYGEDAAKEFAENESKKKSTDGNFRLVIETLEGVATGSINTRVDARRFSFEYGIALARENWGHGYAEEAIQLVCRFMFGELRLHKVQAWVYGFNRRSQSMHEKFGMVLEGTLREGHFTDGRFWDVLVYGMTAEEYFARYGAFWGDLGDGS